jgi:cytochrome bd-type quinol oxidase subunit 1
MFYPQWEVPKIGGGMVIAAIATVHVFVAHFAVGAGLFIAWTEARMARRPDPILKDFLIRFGRFLVLLSFVFGALTGVGIWFAIGLAAPRATSILIHNFVWGWAAEWALFAVEIAAGYVYYYGFDRLSEGRRRAVAYIYAAAAWGSLVVINGILCFMLTPGKWLQTHAFWDGFFNPTYWPSLVLRTISSMSLAA